MQNNTNEQKNEKIENQAVSGSSIYTVLFLDYRFNLPAITCTLFLVMQRMTFFGFFGCFVAVARTFTGYFHACPMLRVGMMLWGAHSVLDFCVVIDPTFTPLC